MNADKTKRINVTFPVALLEELRDKLPRRERNSFIVMATERELRRLKICEVLRHLHEHGPIWSDEDHPDLMTVEDVDRHVRGMRESWMPRSWEEIHASSTANGDGEDDRG